MIKVINISKNVLFYELRYKDGFCKERTGCDIDTKNIKIIKA